MKRCVIIGGAGIMNYPLAKSYLRDDDFAVYCDCGLRHREGLGIAPGLIVGDFDSHEKPSCDTETIVLPTVKDDTDTAYAVKEALARGYDDFLLLGVCGGRLDHTLGNLSLLLALNRLGKTALALDDYSEISAIGREVSFVEDKFAFFSILAFGSDATGVTIRNAKFPLENGEIKADFPLGVSNEVLPGMTAEVSVKNGNPLLFKVFR